MITQEYLKSRLHYDPITGLFTWLYRPDDGTKETKRFNTLRAGKRAGGETSVNRKHGAGFTHRRIRVDRDRFYEHSLAWLYVTGDYPKNHGIDHINHDGTDNRWENLRPSTRPLNMTNKNIYQNNSSGQSGVYQRENGKWRAVIRKRNLGTYDTYEEAVAVRLAAELEHFGAFRATTALPLSQFQPVILQAASEARHYGSNLAEAGNSQQPDFQVPICPQPVERLRPVAPCSDSGSTGWFQLPS